MHGKAHYKGLFVYMLFVCNGYKMAKYVKRLQNVAIRTTTMINLYTDYTSEIHKSIVSFLVDPPS